MNRQELETFLDVAYSKIEYDYLFQKASEDQDFFNTVWELANDLPDEKAWRVLWILDHATEKRNEFIFPILDPLYQKVIVSKNESFIRQTMKLILRCPVQEEYAGGLVDRCVGWMNRMDAKVSTQALGLEFFYKCCILYPEMSPELLAHIEDILERSPSAGYKMRLKEIQKKLEK